MDDAYARKKLGEIYSRIPNSSIYHADTAELIRSELSRLIEANSTLKYEFGVRSELSSEGRASPFHNVKAIIEEPTVPRSSGTRLYPSSLGNDLRIVVRELLLCLPSFESTSPPRSTKSGRPLESKYDKKERIITIGKKEYIIQHNSKAARLCEKVLKPSVQVGNKLAWKELYEYAYEDKSNSQDDWKKIDQIVRNISKQLEKRQMPTVMKFEGGKEGHIQRIR